MSMFEIHGGFTGLAASSRVRLARNIKGYPFRLTEQQHSEIADKIFAALKENPTIGPEFDKKQIIPRSTEASQLVEVSEHPRPLGANTLTRFVHPAGSVQRKKAAARKGAAPTCLICSR